MLNQCRWPREPQTYLSVRSAILLSLILATSTVSADEQEEITLSAETQRLFSRADRAIKDLDGYLTAVKFQNSAMIGTNYFAVSVGGIDAIRDLEESRGVDPETLAALYAGFAIPTVAEHLNIEKVRDKAGNIHTRIDAADGRLRYKGAVVRLYSADHLRELFDRRSLFRTTVPNRRKEIFAAYVYNRRRLVGSIDSSGQANEAAELSRRFEELEPLVAAAAGALRAETSATSIIAGSNSHHYFGFSVGGINVVEQIAQTGSIDPESYAAVFAQRVSIDHADSFEIANGRIKYEGREIKLYSPEMLESYFQKRDRLTLRIARP